MTDLLFVYGTLRSQFNNEYACLLRSHADFVRLANVPGSIYQVDRYPGWKAEPAGIVWGELYRLRDPPHTLEVLDEYEGEDFDRVVVNTPEPAWIYRYKRPVAESARIESGDFCAPGGSF